MNGWWECKQYGGSSNIKKRTCKDFRASLLIIYPKEAEWVYFIKILIYLTPMGLSCGSRDLFCIKQDLSPWPWGLWRMPALPLRYLGLVALLRVGSYIPNQGFNKDWVPFVTRQILNLEFLWPPGMSCEKSVFWRSYLYSYNQYFFIHNNHFSSNNTVLSHFSSS